MTAIWVVWGWPGPSTACWARWCERPDSGGVVLTGRLSMAAQPWLADHAVAGVVLFPGAGFVELALRAGDEVGCAVVEELTLSAPLLLPAADGVQVQVVVGAADGSGRRAVSVYSLGAQAIRNGHCTPRASLSTGSADAGCGFVGVAAGGGDRRWTWPTRTSGWPQRGYEYGPAFQGLQAMWRRGR